MKAFFRSSPSAEHLRRRIAENMSAQAKKDADTSLADLERDENIRDDTKKEKQKTNVRLRISISSPLSRIRKLTDK